MELLVTPCNCKTSYYLIANRLVERFHCQLKAALKSQLHPDRWTDCLPVMLLGIRTTLKQDLRCSPPKLVYGTTQQLPGTSTSFPSTMDITDYIQ